MHKNLTMFKISAKALNEPRIPDYIDSLMRDILTKQCGMIKQKILYAVTIIVDLLFQLSCPDQTYIYGTSYDRSVSLSFPSALTINTTLIHVLLKW